MATRSRTSTPIHYEDFIPKYESKEETGSHVLVLNLPQEFKKEEIRITFVQSTRMIRVNGERPLVNNKWSRFSQIFPLPQNCDVNNIDARYQNGVLTITMPKTKPTAAEPVVATTEEQTKPTQKVTPPPPPPPKEPASTTARKQADDKTATTTTTARTAQKPPLEPKPQKGVENSSSLNAFKDRKEETTQKVAPTKDAMKPKDDMGLSPQEEISKKRKEQVAGESSDSKKRKESIMGEGLKEGKGEEKATEDFIAEKVKQVKGLAASAKRNIQEFSMEVNEDRQAMVNIGVAVLVIVALGTYIYYSRGSSRSAK